jgi:hypothetical protein
MVVGATVRLYWKGCQIGSVTTGINGTYVFGGLAPRTDYTFSTAALLYRTLNCGPITSPASGIRTVAIVLSPLLGGSNKHGCT